MAEQKRIKTVVSMHCSTVYLDCPYCHQTQDGFIGDPSGGEFTCDHCGENYAVHTDADIELR